MDVVKPENTEGKQAVQVKVRVRRRKQKPKRRYKLLVLLLLIVIGSVLSVIGYEVYGTQYHSDLALAQE